MFSDAVGQGWVRPAGIGPSVRVGRLGLSGCFVAYRHSGRISPSFRKLSARCVRSGPPYSVPRPFGGGRPVRPRNAIRTAEPLRTGSGLESRDNGKYGCPGHKGRVMNMRWGRFGSINICLLIDWCNEPTKKIPLGAGRLSFGRFGKTGIPSGGRPLRTSGPELPVVSRWDSKFLCCSMIRVENTLPENALGRRNRLYGRKTG